MFGVAIIRSESFPRGLQLQTNKVNTSKTYQNEYHFSKGKRGAVVPMPSGKACVTIRLDDDVLDWFGNEVDNAGGGNYQTLMNLALREFVSRSREPLASTLRRVIPEEFKTAV